MSKIKSRKLGSRGRKGKSSAHTAGRAQPSLIPLPPLANPLQLFARARATLKQHLDTFAPHSPLHLFVSYTDATTRAQVFHLSGTDLDTLWPELLNELKRRTRTDSKKIAWLRFDWVTEVETHTWGELKTILAATKRNYFRRGISLDPEFKYPFLEQELNANAMLYPGPERQGAQVNPKNFTAYANKRFKTLPTFDLTAQTPVYTFSTGALFISAEQEPLLLNNRNANIGYNSGRRQILLNQDNLRPILRDSARYLASQIKHDGRYIYGIHPCFEREINTYNTLRHASSTYALLEAWEIIPEAGLKRALDRALHRMTGSMIKSYPLPDGDTAAFLLDLNDEIKLGGNAVAILALAKYTELSGDQQYLPLLEHLATGILFMQDKTTGAFTHVLNSADLSTKEPFRIIYYEGEAAFGLMRLYALTHDPRWLQAVEKAFEHFIASSHWQHHDHWLSYCVNELTRYRPERRYYQFGLDNISGYLNFVLERITTFPTLLELMMAAHKMIQRLQSDPHQCDLLHQLDLDKFYRALEHRAHYMLNGHFWPELAMYFNNPRRIIGSFFIRHHGFRIRIDDVEHYLSGYIAYLKHYLGQPTVQATTAHKPQTACIKAPVAQPAPTPPAQAVLSFGGDVNLGRRQHYRAQQLGFSNILPIPELQQGNINMVNLECVVSTTGRQGVNKGEGAPYYYRARPEMVQILTHARINCVATANNHSGDYGSEALLQQNQILRDVGIATVGSGNTAVEAFEPVFIDTCGLRVALFSFDTTQPRFAAGTKKPGIAFISLAQPEQWYPEVTALFSAARSRADIVLVAIHWGANHAEKPSAAQRNAGRMLLQAGAAAILGSSAHNLQGVEIYDNKPIIYAAGDLLFDSERSNLAPGALFQLGLNPAGVAWVRFIPVGIGFGFSRRLYAEQAFTAIHNFMQKCQKVGTNFIPQPDTAILPLEQQEKTQAAERPNPKTYPPASPQNPDTNLHKLAHYKPDAQHGRVGDVPEDAAIEPVPFTNGPILLGVRYHPHTLGTRRILWVETWWKTSQPISENLRLDIQARPLHLANATPWGYHMDHDPCDWMQPTTTWAPEAIYRDFYGLRPPRASNLINAPLQLYINVIGTGLPPEPYCHPSTIPVQIS